MDSRDLVPLGAVTRPHGVRGEVRVHRFNPDSTLLLERETVFLRRDGETREVRIAAARPHGDLVLLTLDGVHGREAAEALRGHEVCVPRDALPPADEDEVYLVDLVGLAAVDEAGSPLGTVSEVLQYPSVECLAVDSDAGRREIPLVDPYVVDIDLETGRVVVAHAEDFELQRPKRPRR